MKAKRPADVVGNAVHVGGISIGEIEKRCAVRGAGSQEQGQRPAATRGRKALSAELREKRAELRDQRREIADMSERVSAIEARDS